MFCKFSENSRKRAVGDIVDEPPEKKLISEGDILIKQLAEKQRNTKVSFNEQFSAENRFYKSTEVVPITSYTSGFASFEEFSEILQYSNNIETLKAYGLTNEEVSLYFDYKMGVNHVHKIHKNMDKTILQQQLSNILKKIKESQHAKKEKFKADRLTTELTLATKPSSISTKLLKFALSNQKPKNEKLPSAMDEIKDIEKNFESSLSTINIEKIQKRARNLNKQIEAIKMVQKEPTKGKREYFLGSASKWDMKEVPKLEIKNKETKTFTCKPQNYYTIKDSQIVKIFPEKTISEKNIKQKLSIEEIKKMPKFEKYEKGEPSKVLYLKNLANVNEEQIEKIFTKYAESIISINIMKGRMKGQAFIEFKDIKCSQRALDELNGVFLKNKPIIIQFGKRKGAT